MGDNEGTSHDHAFSDTEGRDNDDEDRAQDGIGVKDVYDPLFDNETLDSDSEGVDSMSNFSLLFEGMFRFLLDRTL